MKHLTICYMTKAQQLQINTWVNALLCVPTGTSVFTYAREKNLYNGLRLQGCANLGSERATVEFMNGASAPLLRIKALEVSFDETHGHNILMLLK